MEKNTKKYTNKIIAYICVKFILTLRYLWWNLKLSYKTKVYLINILYKYFRIAVFKIPIRKISVVIPNYNYSRYLSDRISTVIQQDYPVYEIIVLDDASSDDSLDVINEIKKACPHVIFKVIVNVKNSGSPFLQWHKGVELASGEYVWIAESDDLSKPEFLKNVIKLFDDETVVLGYCQSTIIDADGNELDDNYLDYVSDISDTKWMESYKENGIDEIKSCLAIKNTIPNVSAVVFRRDILSICLNTYLEEIDQYKMVGDWLVYVYVLSRGTLSFTPDLLNYHRRHGESVIFRNLDINIIKEIVSVQKKISSMFSLSDEVITRADSYSQYLYEQLGLASDGIANLSDRLTRD